MKLTCIDIGTSSLKISFYELEKKHIRINHCEEIELPKLETDEFFNYIIKLVAPMINELEDSNKVLFIIPTKFITTRYLEIPVKGDKKLKQIIPFQLEDSLPFHTKDIHYCYKSLWVNESSHVNVSIIQKETMEDIYNNFMAMECVPDYVTTFNGITPSVTKSTNKNMASIIPEKNFAILDIGHQSSKAIFFNDGEIVFNNQSPVGGLCLTENIRDTYEISHEEAEDFKVHQGFCLPYDQLDEVEETQRIFGLVVIKTLSPLLSDFTKSLLAFRSKVNEDLQAVYLVGGGSELQNVDALLSSEFGLPVKRLELSSLFLSQEEDYLTLKYGVNQLTALSFFNKNVPLNFLQGEFKSRQTSTISPYSTAFFFNRSLLLSLLLSFFLVIELVLVIQQQKPVSKSLTKKMSISSTGIKKGDIRSYRKKPKKLDRFLQKRTKSLTADLKELSTSMGTFEMDNLVTVSSLLSSTKNAKLISFKGNDLNIDLKISFKEEQEVESITNNFKNAFNVIKSQAAGNVLTVRLEVGE